MKPLDPSCGVRCKSAQTHFDLVRNDAESCNYKGWNAFSENKNYYHENRYYYLKPILLDFLFVFPRPLQKNRLYKISRAILNLSTVWRRSNYIMLRQNHLLMVNAIVRFSFLFFCRLKFANLIGENLTQTLISFIEEIIRAESYEISRNCSINCCALRNALTASVK